MIGSPSEIVARLGAITPRTANAAVSTAWIPVGGHEKFRCLLLTGGTAGNINAKIEVAKSVSGTDAADLAGKAITQVLSAGATNKEWIIDLDQDDIPESFTHFRLTATPAADTLLAAIVDGHFPRYAPVPKPANVLQVIR